MFLQGTEFLVSLSLERVGKDTAVRTGAERRRRQFFGGEGAQRRSRQGVLTGCIRCWYSRVWWW